MTSKIIGVGFHKTGTTSLGAALAFLGSRVSHGARDLRAALGAPAMIDLLGRGEYEPILEVAERFDAFEDNPWFLLYRELDRRFPGSKFILTVRDDSRWIASAARYYGRSPSRLRRWIYGVDTPEGNEAVWLDRFRRHNAEVAAYFAGRPDDLLIVDWERGDGWAELCAFLQLTPPSGPFPHRRPPARP